ncbi:MAG: 16S rRNA (cytosine(1402)-N(4))-methyltransferase, partial [Lachnospiraceae bacterium]|nr:16S rRNA (cytosine(1402)-N(4))-methyltransferase [Lachnospiraceae bacterium]
MEFSHEPVLLKETISLLLTDLDGLYVDGTLGGGGHSEAILEHLSPSGRLIGIDQDPEALSYAAGRLSRFQDKFEAIRGNFRDMDSLLAQ